MDYAKILFGENAKHVPAWMYVQDQGAGMVMFVGASRVDIEPNPLRFNSERTHQFVVGELVVRPHFVLGTDALRGTGTGGLATGDHDIEAMLSAGEVILGTRPAGW
jgi:hypothetical protein